MEALNPNNSNSQNPNRVMQSNAANNPLLRSDDDIEKVVSKKCSRHPQRNADFLHLKHNVQQPRICINCIQQDDIQGKEYLQIKEVLFGSSNSDFFTYPVLNDPRLRKEIQSNSDVLDSDTTLIDQFYQELLRQIQAKIETKKQTKPPQILRLGDIYQHSLTCWQKIFEIDKLKQILFAENNESALIQFINTHMVSSDYNTRNLRAICDQFKELQSQFSPERPNQIINSIDSLLDQINFFDNNNSAPPLSIDKSEKSRNELQLNQQEVNQLQEQLHEQQLINEELRAQNQNQSNQISQLTQKLKEEEEKNSGLKNPQIKSTQPPNNPLQQPSLYMDGKVMPSKNDNKFNVAANIDEDQANPLNESHISKASITKDDNAHTAEAPGNNNTHFPSPNFATPIEVEPDFTNNDTKAAQQKCGDFIYDEKAYEDKDAIELPPHQLENGSVYKGQWKNGMRHGRGKQVWKDGSIYEGYWKNNMANGKGRLIHSDADVYEGEWKNDKADGTGTYTHVDGTKHIGQWVDDKQEGNGIEIWPDGSKFDGQFFQGKKQGKGKIFWTDGSRYEGQFSNNIIHGFGIYTWADGRNYKGDWKNGKMDGQGEFEWPDERKYNGSYLEDMKHGYGEFEWPDGRRYKGQWSNGKQHGAGVFISAQGKEMSGEWADGKRIKWTSEDGEN